MTFIKPQRQAAPWSQHNFWGQYDEAANLPNTATSDIQVASIELQRGDTAWAESEGSLYYCDDPTAGAAVWVAIGGGGGGGVTLASDYYLSGDNGDDANDGLTPATAVATLGRILDILNTAEYTQQGTPIVIHIGRNTATGFYEWNQTLGLQLYDDLVFYGDGAGQAGEDGFVELVAPTATDAGSSVQQIVLAAGPIPGDNDFIGRTVEVLTGAAAGDRRTIRNHTTTLIVPVRPFSDAVAPGDTFRIVEPEVAIRPTRDVNKPLLTAFLHKQTAPVVPVVANTTELYDLELTGHLVFANLLIQNDTVTFDTFQYSGSLKVFGCQRDTPSTGNMSILAHKMYAGLDVQNGLWDIYDPLSVPNFADLTGTAHTPVRAGLASGLASWSGWGWSAARFMCKHFLGYIVFESTSPSVEHAQILGGSAVVRLNWSSNGLTIFGTRSQTDPSSDVVIPFLFNATGTAQDYGLWIRSGSIHMGSVEFTPLTRFGVIIGADSFILDAATKPTLKWASNQWQVLASEVAFMYVQYGGRLIIGEAVPDGGSGGGRIDFSGINGLHLALGQYDTGPYFEAEVPDVRDLQGGDSIQAIDGSIAILLSSTPIPP